MDLIPIITNENSEQLVLGRDLYEFLEVNEKYTQWFDRMVTYGFDENVDFISFPKKRKNLKEDDLCKIMLCQLIWRKRFQ